MRQKQRAQLFQPCWNFKLLWTRNEIATFRFNFPVGSMLFFVISDLSKLNTMYCFSLASFLRLFQQALQNKQDVGNTDLRIRALTMTLQSLVYEYVCRSLFKADRLIFAMPLSMECIAACSRIMNGRHLLAN